MELLNTDIWSVKWQRLRERQEVPENNAFKYFDFEGGQEFFLLLDLPIASLEMNYEICKYMPNILDYIRASWGNCKVQMFPLNADALWFDLLLQRVDKL